MSNKSEQSLYLQGSMTKSELAALDNYALRIFEESKKPSWDFMAHHDSVTPLDRLAEQKYGVSRDPNSKWDNTGLGWTYFYCTELEESFDKKMPHVERSFRHDFYFSGHDVLFHNDNGLSKFQWMYIRENVGKHLLLSMDDKGEIQSLCPQRGDIVFMNVYEDHSLLPVGPVEKKLEFYAICFDIH